MGAPPALEAYRESAFQARGNQCQLIGIYCEPAEPGRDAGTTVIMLPGQPHPRVGAHRMFVQLARQLARGGFASLRFDTTGWGDSLAAPQPFEEARFDLLTVCQALHRKRPEQRIVLLGLSDGASAACLALPLLKADQRFVDALVMLNPWIDPVQIAAKSQLRSYYIDRLRSGDFWRKLASGRVPVVRTLKHAGLLMKDRLESKPVEPAKYAEAMLQALEATATRALVVLSDNDLTAHAFVRWLHYEPRLRTRIRRDDILHVSESDHTFSAPDDWALVCDWIAKHLRG